MEGSSACIEMTRSGTQVQDGDRNRGVQSLSAAVIVGSWQNTLSTCQRLVSVRHGTSVVNIGRSKAEERSPLASIWRKRKDHEGTYCDGVGSDYRCSSRFGVGPTRWSRRQIAREAPPQGSGAEMSQSLRDEAIRIRWRRWVLSHHRGPLFLAIAFCHWKLKEQDIGPVPLRQSWRKICYR